MGTGSQRWFQKFVIRHPRLEFTPPPPFHDVILPPSTRFRKRGYFASENSPFFDVTRPPFSPIFPNSDFETIV